jgi:ATP-dependent 26S proteasome regulatory subunit
VAETAPTPTNQERLQALIVASHPCLAIVSAEETYALELVKTTALQTGHEVVVWSATRGVTGGVFEDSEPIPNTEHPAAALYHFAHRVDVPTLCVTLDLVDHLGDARTLRALRDVVHGFQTNENCLVLIDHRDTLPEIIAVETTRLDLDLPTEPQLERIVRNTLKRMHRHRPIQIDLKRSDLQTIIRNLRGLTRDQAEQVIADCVAEDRTFDAADINAVLARKRQRLHRDRLLQFVEAPVDLSEIGGLRKLKQWLKRRRNALGDAARAYGLPAPRGILLLGVQGAGKSLCAKAVAAAWQRPLLRLDPGTLYDRYIGESERRLRSALRQAEAMAPLVLWIDEIEKGFASAASHSTDGGLSQRMFGTLLTWMQEHEAPVFLLATANDVAALPPELLRKGRFDEIFFIDLPRTTVRRKIFEIHLAKRDRDPGAFDVGRLAEAAKGYSGAEIEQAIIAAMHTAFSDSAEVDTDRVLAAIAESPPLSVTMAERVDRLRTWASERCVPAD